MNKKEYEKKLKQMYESAISVLENANEEQHGEALDMLTMILAQVGERTGSPQGFLKVFDDRYNCMIGNLIGKQGGAI